MLKVYKNSYPVLKAGGGNQLNINEFVLDSGKCGPDIYIQAGLHGGETAQWCLADLVPFLRKNLCCGRVRIVPYANPLAWLQRCYFSTNGKFSLVDGKDFNRCFPGNADGDVNGRIAAAILNIADRADVVLDLHTSKNSQPFVIYTKEEYEHLVKAAGMKYNQFSRDVDIPALQGTFNAELDRRKIANLTIECGSHNQYDAEKISQVVRVIKNILAYNKIIGADLMPANEILKFEQRKKIYASADGLAKFEKQPGDIVLKEEIIAKIHAAADIGQEEAVSAPESGVILTELQGHIVWEGDVLAEIIPQSNLKKL